MSASVVLSSKDPHVKNPLKAFFNERGYQVIIEGQGSSALLKALEEPVDLFINDFPEDGDLNLDIIEIIRKMKPRVPIVGLCANTSLAIIRKLSEVGVFYCAMKPIQIGEMEKVVEAVERLHVNKAKRSAGTIR